VVGKAEAAPRDQSPPDSARELLGDRRCRARRPQPPRSIPPLAVVERIDAPAASLPVRRTFIAITAAMWLGLAVGIPLVLAGMPYSVLLVEVWEILLFIAFWLVATRTEWVVQDGTTETRV
jgi:hypothetical protein